MSPQVPRQTSMDGGQELLASQITGDLEHKRLEIWREKRGQREVPFYLILTLGDASWWLELIRKEVAADAVHGGQGNGNGGDDSHRN